MRVWRKIANGVRTRLVRWLNPSPVKEYGERTMIYVTQGDASQPNAFLMDLTIDAIQRARNLSIADLNFGHRPNAIDYPDLWPGEHYRLLAALVATLQPLTVVEVGTYHGLSALALKKFLPPRGKITTFDIIPWDRFEKTCLRRDDFADGRLVQELADLADRRVFDSHRALFANAQLIFIDGPKDGRFERLFLEHLSALNASGRKLLVLDDVRTWNMLAIWREITFHKLDLTSFGHWTGTGLVDWNPNAKS
jgi:predicted O-methyltransferase YrrM